MSTGWPDATYRDLGDSAGRACFRLLLLEELWVHRRVEAVHVRSPQLVRRQVSVDFTVPARLVDLLAVAEKQWTVPVTTLRKATLRHFDLRDEENRAVAVLSRAQNALVAEGALAAAAQHALRRAPSAAVRRAFAAIAVGNPPDARAEVERLAAAAERGDRECSTLLADEYVRFLLTDLADNYLLLACLDDLRRRRVVKIGHDDALELARERGMRERLGWRGQPFTHPTPAAGRTASYHAEVIVPDELRLASSALVDLTLDRSYAVEGESDRATLHAIGVPRDARVRLVFTVGPERAGFPVLAAAVTVVTALLLLSGALLADLARGQAAPTISVLLAASAFYAATVARAEEHRLVRWLFALPRALVALTALCAVFAAATVAFRAAAWLVELAWTLGGVIAALAAGTLVTAAARSLPIARPGLEPIRTPPEVE